MDICRIDSDVGLLTANVTLGDSMVHDRAGGPFFGTGVSQRAEGANWSTANRHAWAGRSALGNVCDLGRRFGGSI